MLGELPPPLKLLGVVLIVAGSLAMHRRLFAVGWLAPVKAVIQEKGSRYMLMVSFIFSITNPLDKKLVVMSDVFTEAFSYGLGLCLAFFVWGKAERRGFPGGGAREREVDFAGGPARTRFRCCSNWGRTPISRW